LGASALYLHFAAARFRDDGVSPRPPDEAVIGAHENGPCQGSETAALKTRLNVKDLECGMMLFTSYPAKRHVSFELDGVNYEATVEFKDAETVQPLSLVTVR
jgi:hypothetical protein